MEISDVLDRYVEKEVRNSAISIKFKNQYHIKIINKYASSFLRFMNFEDYKQEICIMYLDLIEKFLNRHGEELDLEMLDKYISKYLKLKILQNLEVLRKESNLKEEALAQGKVFYQVFKEETADNELIEFRYWFKEEMWNKLTSLNQTTYKHLISLESNNQALYLKKEKSSIWNKRKERLIKKVEKDWSEFKKKNKNYLDLNHRILLEFENLIQNEDVKFLEEYFLKYLDDDYAYILDVATKNLTSEEVKKLDTLVLDLDLNSKLYKKVAINLLNELYKKDKRFNNR